MSDIKSGDTVVVTGATGFIGSHIVKQLLEKGYNVHACVRDATSEKSAFLKSFPGTERLKLYSADLLVDNAFDEALVGAHALIHTAAAVMLTAQDPQKQIVDVTVNGAINVLRSCEKAARAGTFKRFVSTSSIAAVMDTNRPKTHVYTEADTNESATLAVDPYSLSKVLEEKAIDEFVAALGPDARFSHVFINPGAVYGPVLAKHHIAGSNAIIFDMVSGKYPMIPNLGFPGVDVRDVAAAHVLALEHAELTGRHLCTNGPNTMRELAEAGKKAFPQYKWPSWGLPNALMYVAAIFDSRISFAFLKNNLNILRQVSSDKLIKATGIRLRPILDECVPDAMQSYIDIGALPKK